MMFDHAIRRSLSGALAATWAWSLAAAGVAADLRPDAINEILLPPTSARYVRLLILECQRGQPCIDELEIFADGGRDNLALAAKGAKASASSCLAGHAIHRIEHLNDGQYGNAHSWIAAGTSNEWAQIELPGPAKIAKLVFSRDRSGQYQDRTPTRVEVQVSDDGQKWRTLQPTKIRLTFIAAAGALPSVPPPPGAKPAVQEVIETTQQPDDVLRYAFLGEEHAWLKAYGRADVEPRLLKTPYREKKNPQHVGDDRLPLAVLPSAPKLSAEVDDPAWRLASRGVVRVADPTDFARGPLVEHALQAGVVGNDLYLAIRVDRLLSSHVAVLSTLGSADASVLAIDGKGLILRSFRPAVKKVAGSKPGMIDESRLPIDGVFSPDHTRIVARVPLDRFPEWQERGLRVGLGMGGKHTDAAGRPVTFVSAALTIAQCGPCVKGVFPVRVSLPASAAAATLHGNVPELQAGLRLNPGESRQLAIRAEGGPIGPQFNLEIRHADSEYTLQLFRYDPSARTLALLDEMVDRLAAKGLDVRAERAQAAAARRVHERLLAAAPDPAAERKAFWDARRVKRDLLLREPDLQAAERILFEKRHAFEPSHNYSDPFDSKWRAGGGVYVIEVPRRNGRLAPEQAQLKCLFESAGGVSRNPMATFDTHKIYFAYRQSQAEYYHVMVMNADGSGVKQLTDGPFHDYWPCPLPDGGLAYISTRCRARFLCWRPQAAVLFRMDADGGNERPLSFANLTEWGPSVMNDGRIIWQRSEYQDKGADYSHTLWAIRPDGTMPELVFGNTILLPQGYANGREVPGTKEISCTLISHFGDLNGPIALCDTAKGRFNPDAITSLTPEVPWPGYPPHEEAFREPVPLAKDYFLVSHAPRRVFGLYLLDRFGNREVLYLDSSIGSMCPTLYRPVPVPPVLTTPIDQELAKQDLGEFAVADVYQGLGADVPRGAVKWLRVAQEVRADLIQMSDGSYQRDHEPFMQWYATPVDRVRGPFGWPSYVAKGSYGLVPVSADGSANFLAPAGKVLYFQLLDEQFNEVQRMRSVVQLQPGEKRTCVGCHDDRRAAPVPQSRVALLKAPVKLEAEPWGTGALAYEKVVQPVWDAKCVSCHNAADKRGIDLTATLDVDRVPASYRTLITQGWVHYLDWGYQSGGNAKVAPLTFGSVKSKLWPILERGHYDVQLTRDEMRAVKCWIDMNCPLWPDYIFRPKRPGPPAQVTTR